MHKNLVLELRMANNLVDLVAFDLFLANFEVVVRVYVSSFQGYVPEGDYTVGVANIKSTLVVEC